MCVGRVGKGSAGVVAEAHKLVLVGVAYYHAGLTLEEREMLEQPFRRGVRSILVATSMLAAGVFRTSNVGRSFLSPCKYRQMAGRASRKGIDAYGESIVLCKDDADAEHMRRQLIHAPLQPVRSQLLNSDTDNLQRFMLEGYAVDRSALA